MPIVKCDYCGKELKRSSSKINKSKKHFCNVDCKKAYGKLSKQEVKCANCGKLFLQRKERVARNNPNNCFCSRACYDEKRKTNEYIFREDYIELIITNSKNKKFITKIDTEDYETVKQYHWGILGKHSRYTEYVYTKTSKYTIDLHRMLTNCPKGMVVDHINADGLDNRKENLRICTNAENIQNGKIRSNNKTGVNGVQFHQKAYVASITANNIQHYLGRFKTLEEAKKAREDAEIKYFGEFRRAAI